MAEPVSGVITLVTFSRVVIKETKKFLKAIKETDTTIANRLVELNQLEKYTVLVEQQCNSGLGHEDILRFINESLQRLKPQLEHVQRSVRELASRESETLYQRFKTQVRLKLSEKDVNEAMRNLAHHQNIISDTVNLGIYQFTANAERRRSEASPTTLDPSTPVDWKYPYAPSFPSIDFTVYEDPVERSPSRTTQPSLESSGPNIVRTEDVNDISLDIHYHITQAENSESRLRAVRQLLDEPLASSQLVEKRDQYGHTPLCRAVIIGDFELARTLVDEFGANINATDDQPCSVLEHAISKKRNALVEFLIAHDVDEENVASKNNRIWLEEAKGEIELRREHTRTKSKQKVRRGFSFRENTSK